MISLSFVFSFIIMVIVGGFVMIKDIINKKRVGEELSRSELEEAFLGYLKGSVPDYQMSSLLMAICIQGMSLEETFILTDLFLNSGDQLDFSMISSIKVDKHSTGGVGDKTTLVVVPVVASCFVPVIKMSGRGLGYTGGTIDKLESIPFYKTELLEDDIRKQMADVHAVMMGQTRDLCPLDKKIYALRDVSGTTDSIPLIAASIMSKKIAGGADKILIDIKVGVGAFMKTREDAEALSDIMIKIGEKYGKETRTIISDMNTPLGRTVGNALEVEEALFVLEGKDRGEFYRLCVELASQMVSMGKNIPVLDAQALVEESISSGKAYRKFLEIVSCQGGKIDELKVSQNVLEIKSEVSGVVQSIDALEVAKLSCLLGAGRLTKEDVIDPGVGVYLNVLVGDKVKVGDTLLCLYRKSDDNKIYDISKIFEIK